MRDSDADAGSSPVNDAPTPTCLGTRAQARREPALGGSRGARAEASPPHPRLGPRRARVGGAARLDDRQLGSDPGPRLQRVRQQHRRDPPEQGRPGAAQHLRRRPALRQRRRPGPNRAEAAAPRPAARRSGHGGDETARHERGGDGARLASSSGSRRHRDQRGAAALRQPDRGQGPVRLDPGRRRHPRIREPRRRPCQPPGRRPLDDLPDPGLHPAVLDGAQAAPDDDPEQDRVHASDALPGAGGHAQPRRRNRTSRLSKRMPPSSTRPSRASSRRSRASCRRPPPSSRAGCPTSRPVWPSSTSGWPQCSDRPPRCSRIRARRTSSSSTPRSPRSRRESPTCSTVRRFSTPASSS